MFTGIFTWRNLVLGLASWAVPFLAAFAFFDSSGTLAIAQPLFKSLMVVIGGGVGAGLLVLAFRRIPGGLSAGFALGLFWLVLNWGLDIALLLPMSGQGIAEWFQDIGLRYLVLLFTAMAMGSVAAR
ncbi:MAG: hypothetical protein KDK00_06120 [Rhodobacteraceae bacterium]|nr:hypothetical protein [Paracoccaceae bacterium]